ncbi:MAG: GNAT family N-acetyltransferase [Rickettsiales bacterium]|jgi:ribosomal-protein-alanine N-acetyltransferase|nr:GNAT family N-acetyltransferase [Rickettsiales bacterium]
MAEYSGDVIFRSDKYIARTFDMGNFDEFCALNQDPLVARYVNHNGGKPKTFRECVAKYNDIVYSQNKFGYSYWAIYGRAKNDFIGQCGALKAWISDSNTFCYAFKKEYWGRGIGTEICSIVLDYLFENVPTINTIETTAYSENIASVKILKKLGFQHIYSEKEFELNLEFFKLTKADYVQKKI